MLCLARAISAATTAAALPAGRPALPGAPRRAGALLRAEGCRVRRLGGSPRQPAVPRRRSGSGAAGAARAEQARMDPAVEVTAEKIHSAQPKVVLYVTGGASQAPGWLLSVPGASRTVLDVRVPYARDALAETLGGAAPEQFASAETAAALARAAYRKAVQLTEFGVDVVGVGATCALATDWEKRGEHRAFVATHNGASRRAYALTLSKGARDRLGEDTVASKLLVKAVAEAMGVGTQVLELGLLEAAGGSGDGSRDAQPAAEVLQVEVSSSGGPDVLLRELMSGRVQAVEFSGGNIFVDAPRAGRIYLPGSYNPLHGGHQELLQAACRLQPGMEGCFELSIGNADKGLMPLEEIQRRVSQFVAAGLPLVVTQAPLFTQKADLFPRSVFVVGYDTAVRLVKPEYYGTDTAMLLQFARLHHQGCSFLVAGRRADDGSFRTLADVPLPEVLQRGGLFSEVPEHEFRADISSTELRARGVGLAPAAP